jgi:hypothetical protein
LPSEAASALPQASTAGGSPTVAENASAGIELPEVPTAALPPVDPLVKAVQQSIDEAQKQ